MRSDSPYISGIMRPVFADPKVDLVFKRIFGNKAHKQVLIQRLARLRVATMATRKQPAPPDPGRGAGAALPAR